MNCNHIYLNQVECHIYFIQTTTMDIRDFEGLFKYKLILPIIYIASWVCMFLGPSLFPVIYQLFSISIILYTISKVFIIFFTYLYVNVKAQSTFTKIKNNKEKDYMEILPNNDEILFGFILPNYKQELDMMSETLEFLAKQKRAKDRFLIFLAMEAHEEKSELKAYSLIQSFKDKFRVIDFTQHHLREFQQKGKASNVSWCAQHLQPIFQKNMIEGQNVYLTIMDADSWAPQQYFNQVQEYLVNNVQLRYLTIFSPPQIFTRNYLQVPVLTRVYDMMHSYAHCSQLYALSDICFPLSNYTISYQLIKRIGFWDTCPDAIGEDFHTTQKAFWKTQGQTVTKPIYVPFNQVNISTGNGYIADIKARFWQAERHAQGVADMAYNIKMFTHNTFSMRGVSLLLSVIQICVLPAILPWVFLSFTYQTYILYNYSKPSPELYSDKSLSYLFNTLSIMSLCSYMMYEIFKRRANKIIYQKQNESLLRILQYPILITVNLFLISMPTFTIAAFSVLFSQREYIVADKKNTVKKMEENL